MISRSFIIFSLLFPQHVSDVEIWKDEAVGRTVALVIHAHSWCSLLVHQILVLSFRIIFDCWVADECYVVLAYGLIRTRVLQNRMHVLVFIVLFSTWNLQHVYIVSQAALRLTIFMVLKFEQWSNIDIEWRSLFDVIEALIFFLSVIERKRQIESFELLAHLRNLFH